MALNKLIIITLLFASCAKSQPYFGRIAGTVNQQTSLQPLLLIIAGESNSGGIALNSYATSPELAKRKLKILNNSTLSSFDSLDIGSNNLVGHCGLQYAASTGHGLELQIANSYDSGYFGNRNVYLCKAGQGGTVISQWADEATYTAETTVEPYDTYFERVDSAIAIVTRNDTVPICVLIWSQGINDGGGNTTFWKNSTKSLFNDMRVQIPSLPIYITRFDSMSDYYYTQMVEIASEIGSVKIISSAGCETSTVVAGAGSHWGYWGMKELGRRIITEILSDL